MINTLKKYLILFFYLPGLVLASEIHLYRDPFMPAKANIQNVSQPAIETWIPLYFIKANHILSMITNRKNGFLSSNGQAQADTQTNQLWIKDDKKHITHIKKLVQYLDKRSPQFLIKARIIMVDKRYEKSLGFQFNSITNTAQHTTTQSLTMNTPENTSQTNTFIFNIAKLSDNTLINLKLSALEQEGHATLISSPTLITLNKKSASIESGAEVPYEEATSSGATSVSFKKAVLKLKVTPELLPHQEILLRLALNQDKVSALTVKGVPAIETQQMTTQVITNNNAMILLGGIIEDNHAIQTDGIPILGHTPLIGRLFQHKKHQTEQQILLVCITPMILN